MDKVPETIFPVNRKFPERCSGIRERYRVFREKIPKNVKDILN